VTDATESNEAPKPPATLKSQARPVVLNRRRWGIPGVVLRGFVVLGVVMFFAGGLLGFGIYAHHAVGLGESEVLRFKDPARSTVTRLRASDGQLVGEWFVERRIALSFEELPQRLILAFLAAEDARFFSHGGVDVRGVLRAAVTNLAKGKIAGGGSTITQQLAKISVGKEKSLTRKVRQTVLARRMEDLLTKEEILTLYLNSIFLGHHSYGVQAAAQNYFHKQVWELTLAESAMIAGLPQSPSRINPIASMASARRRMGYVLDQMLRWGWATVEEVNAAKAEEIHVFDRADLLGDNTPYVTEAVRMNIQKRYGAEDDPSAWLRHGLDVTMHVEPARQAAGRRTLSRSLEKLARAQGWAGSLGTLPRDRFFRRNARWLGPTPPAVGDRVLARVVKAGKHTATVEIGEGLGGTIQLKTSRWMMNYTELPKKRMSAKQRRRRKVSYKSGRLTRLDKRLVEGHVVMVEVKGGQPDALDLEIVPVPLMEGAIVGFEVDGRGIDTAVGGWDFDRNQVHRMYALRQTGSTMKPIIYGKLYDMGVPPSKLFSGAPFVDKKYDTGPKAKRDRMLWDALARSENNVSLRALQHLLRHTTLKDYEAWGKALGLPLSLQANTAYVLGGDQTPFGMAHAWGVFARAGMEPDLSLVKKVVDRDGRVLERNMSPLDPHATLGDTVIGLWEAIARPPERRISAATAYLIRENMAQVVKQGTARRARKLKRPAAGKTGTLAYDVWFNGFTADRGAVVWIGANNRERPLGLSEAINKVTGSNTALPLWIDYIAAVERDRPRRDFPKAPPEIVPVRVDPKTGLLAREGGVLVPHKRGTEPKHLTPDATSPDNVGVLETEF